uniref:Uncharacterized protein n=1 Tax=Panagrolaimus davidi TaxID=227884 RepID=A0A914NXW4_9BILA
METVHLVDQMKPHIIDLPNVPSHVIAAPPQHLIKQKRAYHQQAPYQPYPYMPYPIAYYFPPPYTYMQPQQKIQPPSPYPGSPPPMQQSSQQQPYPQYPPQLQQIQNPPYPLGYPGHPAPVNTNNTNPFK